MYRIVILASALALFANIASAQQWNRFRGPNGSGVHPTAQPPLDWSEENLSWSLELPGAGHSSPVVWGEKLFATVADQETGKRHVLCVNRILGKLLWQRTESFESFKHSKNNSSASHTPAVDAHHLYVLWQTNSSSVLVAYRHDGRESWRTELASYHGGHGPGTSPIVYQDMVILGNDMGKVGESYLLALNSQDGQERWKVKRIGDRACYSTPCVFRSVDSDPQLIFTHSYRGVVAVDPANGEQLWSLDVFGTHNQRAIGSPVVAGTRIIGSSGFTTGIKTLVAIEPERVGQEFTPREAYRLNKTVPHVPTPLVYKDRLCLWTDTGIVGCFDVTSGKLHWQGRVGGTFYSSPVCASGIVYAADRDGRVSVVDVRADRFHILAQNELGQPSAATPAIADNSLFFKTDARLLCIGGQRPASGNGEGK